MGGRSETLLSKGTVLRIELTVMGARWRKKESRASPFLETAAVHSTFDTEPAGWEAEDINGGLSATIILFFAKHQKKTYEATSAGGLNPEAF